MGMTVSEDSEPADGDGKSLGVRFAESRVGRPIVRALLFITGSFWLMVTSAGVLLLIVAATLGEGVIAGVIGAYGLSALFVGLLGYSIILVIRYRQEEKS